MALAAKEATGLVAQLRAAQVRRRGSCMHITRTSGVYATGEPGRQALAASCRLWFYASPSRPR